MEDYNLRYPIGEFDKPAVITIPVLENWIETIGSFPGFLGLEVVMLTDEQLDTPYRTGGWTIRQVVHHCADSHMNAFARFKFALTEENSVIKPYKEALWAELYDSRSLPVASSLSILKGLHQRWYQLLKSLDEASLKRKYIHPERGQEFALDVAIGMYAWHSSHHLAHIKSIKRRMHWK
ncbi:YfiT family bacillithiol transferase [Parapedobacter sp. 10938]|uniref:YfiT family bacillithiol transferase n=1 Tax=Parapedobacter flavus TaxID=3110225 RepID=UPI002DBB609B|nr:putative metal-dependent hydrolase [Parapedobacter sp. 10938]MEC3881621.1 putative metal-dependent hydrolase [Parapedobacter sp. 10938]